MKRILAVDVGSTSIKWGLHDGQVWQAFGNISDTRQLESQTLTQIPTEIILCNVGHPQHTEALMALAAAWHITCHCVRARQNAYGIENKYAKPDTLGADRWAAMIGARAMYKTPLLVIDAGTALTIDYIDRNGHFKGGSIAPGFAIMKRSLTQNTVNLKQLDGQWSLFPDNTADAVTTGCIQALTCPIEAAYQRFHAQNPDLHCVMTGGDTEWLRPYLNIPIHYEKHLVLEGLRYIATQSRT